MKRILAAAGAIIAAVLAGVWLVIVANCNHIDFTPVAFGAAATVFALLLPAAALVGSYIADQLPASAMQIQELADTDEKASAHADAAAKEALNDPAKANAATEARNAADAAKTLFAERKAGTKAEFEKLFFTARWLQWGMACAFLSFPVSAAALVIGAPELGHRGLDWRATMGAIAIALLIEAGVGIAPITWRILNLKMYRSWVEAAF